MTQQPSLPSGSADRSASTAPKSSPAAPLVSIAEVGKIFRVEGRGGSAGSVEEFVALAGINLRIDRGEFVSLLGPSGCGKTTLLRMMAGLVTPTTGSIQFDGRSLTGPDRQVGMVFQNFGLLPWRTARQNILFPLEIDGKKDTEGVVDEFIDLFGLRGFADRYPHELSGGMQQRVGIARAFARNPVLLLMDEPFGALDAQTREQLQDDLLEIVDRRKCTVIFVTHSIDEALMLSERIVVMARNPGHIIADYPVSRDELPRGSSALETPAFGPARKEIRTLLQQAHG